MSVGTLHTSIVLNEPGKIYCGNRAPVRGRVSIRFSPGKKNAGDELFGPPKVLVTLHGRAKTKIWKSNGQTTTLYRGRAPLISQGMLVYNDSFRAQPGDTIPIPFSLIFPEVTDAMDRDEFPEDSRFIHHYNQPLPPTFHSFYQGFAHHYEAFVEYRIGVDLIMPHLKVDVDKPTKYLEPLVYYKCPGTSQLEDARPCHWDGCVSVSNELLLAESDRPSGFKQKTKAFFGAGHFPTYTFDWLCLGNRDIYLGQPASFEIHIRPREKECTATMIPKVRLKYFHLDIVAHTKVRAHRRTFSCPESESNYPIGEITGIILNDGSFSKDNGNTLKINTLPLRDPKLGLFTSSFATYNISRTYTFKIAFAFEITDKVERVSKEYGVTVHPPLEVPLESVLPPLEIAGRSSLAANTSNKTSELL